MRQEKTSISLCVRIKSGIFGQTAKFGHRPCLLHITKLQGRRKRLYHVEAHKRILSFQIAKNKGADQTARMRMLICAFIVRKQQSQGFSH